MRIHFVQDGMMISVPNVHLERILIRMVFVFKLTRSVKTLIQKWKDVLIVILVTR